MSGLTNIRSRVPAEAVLGLCAQQPEAVAPPAQQPKAVAPVLIPVVQAPSQHFGSWVMPVPSVDQPRASSGASGRRPETQDEAKGKDTEERDDGPVWLQRRATHAPHHGDVDPSPTPGPGPRPEPLDQLPGSMAVFEDADIYLVATRCDIRDVEQHHARAFREARNTSTRDSRDTMTPWTDGTCVCAAAPTMPAGGRKRRRPPSAETADKVGEALGPEDTDLALLLGYPGTARILVGPSEERRGLALCFLRLYVHKVGFWFGLDRPVIPVLASCVVSGTATATTTATAAAATTATAATASGQWAMAAQGIRTTPVATSRAIPEAKRTTRATIRDSKTAGAGTGNGAHEPWLLRSAIETAGTGLRDSSTDVSETWTRSQVVHQVCHAYRALVISPGTEDPGPWLGRLFALLSVATALPVDLTAACTLLEQASLPSVGQALLALRASESRLLDRICTEMPGHSHANPATLARFVRACAKGPTPRSPAVARSLAALVQLDSGSPMLGRTYLGPLARALAHLLHVAACLPTDRHPEDLADQLNRLHMGLRALLVLVQPQGTPDVAVRQKARSSAKCAQTDTDGDSPREESKAHRVPSPFDVADSVADSLADRAPDSLSGGAHESASDSARAGTGASSKKAAQDEACSASRPWADTCNLPLLVRVLRSTGLLVTCRRELGEAARRLGKLALLTDRGDDDVSDSEEDVELGNSALLLTGDAEAEEQYGQSSGLARGPRQLGHRITWSSVRGAATHRPRKWHRPRSGASVTLHRLGIAVLRQIRAWQHILCLSNDPWFLRHDALWTESRLLAWTEKAGTGAGPSGSSESAWLADRLAHHNCHVELCRLLVDYAE